MTTTTTTTIVYVLVGETDYSESRVLAVFTTMQALEAWQTQCVRGHDAVEVVDEHGQFHGYFDRVVIEEQILR